MVADRRLLAASLAGVGLTLLIVLLGYRPAGNGIDVSGYVIGRDFVNFWAGTGLAVAGRVETLFAVDDYNTAVQALLGPLNDDIWYIWSYPPHALPVFTPLAGLAYFPALGLFLTATLALFLWAVLAGCERDARHAALLLILLAPATHLVFYTGQSGFLTAALFLGCLVLLDRRSVAAGILAGLLTIKPQLGLVLGPALLVTGQWRAAAAAATTGAVLFVVSVAFYGLDAWRAYLTVTAPNVMSLLTEGRGFQTNMLVSPFNAARQFGLQGTAPWLVQAAFALPVWATALLAVRRAPDRPARALLLGLATMIVTPYAFNYDMPLVAGAIVWWMLARREREPIETALLIGVWLLPVLTFYNMWVNLAFLPLLPVGAFAVVAGWILRGQQSSASPAVPAPHPA